MLLVSYDISEDKLRTNFSKYLSKFGSRMQYSVFEIKNSDRILKNIQVKIENYFGKRFQQTDSVIIFELSKSCKITRYGYAKNDDEELIII
ncbi:MAG: CRISPR-associated endonuclease Cas2 [Sphingobacteriales bacterium]|jgi:CRISPR-associated protein Cas2|nr:CRISPR-associated endonuclease Cas2 [Sphingobacteriales bacterium]